jgi:hypothetical protein
MTVFLRFLTSCRPLVVVGIVLMSWLAAGCQGPGQAGTESIQPAYNKDTGRLERITYDRNQDGKVDAWLYMDGTRVVMAELDENYDGKADRWEYYGDRPATAPARDGNDAALPRNVIVRAEQSTRDDGRVNRWEAYENGRLAGVEEDTTGDGRVDKWETYSGSVLKTMALDTRGTGRPDRRIVFPEDGQPSQLEVDKNGDGHFTPVTKEH